MLEFLANRYHLNPKPRLIFAVEGQGEEKQFPRLAEKIYGVPFSRVGIEVVNLNGIDGFTGKKNLDKYSALEKFIDYHHSRQTYVFIVLDNEGRAAQVAKALLGLKSKFHPKRKVTREKNIYLWNTSIEFDNFTHEEIASAMTKLSEGRYTFTTEEIAACEAAQKAKKGDPLRGLFQEKVNYTLSKPKLLNALVDRICECPDQEADEHGNIKRKIVQLVKEVIDLAAKNHQPVTIDIWQKNQESGSLGDVLPEEAQSNNEIV